MRWSDSLKSAARWVACITLAMSLSGCAHLVETGVRSLVGDEGPNESRGGQSALPSAASSDEDGPVRSVYQSAPTLDWLHGTGPRPFTPGLSLFTQVSPMHVSCQAVPVGLANVFAGPSGPAASPLVRLGPIELGVAGPDGAFEAIFATSREAVSRRALRSGARMARQGQACGNEFSLYVRIGAAPEPVLAHR